MPARSAPDTVSSHAHACPTPCLELRLLAARRRSNSLAVSPRGCSSAGRAAALQAVGRGFESLHLHDVMSKNFHDVMSKNFGDVGTWGVCGAWRRRSGGGPTRDTAEKRRALERWFWKRRCRLQLRGPGRPGASLLRDVGTRQSENPEQFRLKARRSSDETPGWGGDCDVQWGPGVQIGELTLALCHSPSRRSPLCCCVRSCVRGVGPHRRQWMRVPSPANTWRCRLGRETNTVGERAE